MATTTKTPTEKPKAARASKKPAHQTHGALAPRQPMNMMKAFGIRDGYDTDSLDEYRVQIEKMTTSDLHEHAHARGIVPLDARDKLTRDLERKFIEAKMSQRGSRQIHVKTNPALAGFMTKFASPLSV